jgi:hypothetical protein
LIFNATNCSQFYAGLYFAEFGPKGTKRNFLNVTFKEAEAGLCRIRWHEQTNITDFLEKEEQD